MKALSLRSTNMMAKSRTSDCIFCSKFGYCNMKAGFLALLMLSSAFLCTVKAARHAPASRSLSELVPPTPLILDYHGGQLLSGRGSLLVFLIWYGDFSPSQKSIVADFIESLRPGAATSKPPSTAGFWKIISSYGDASNVHVKNSVKLGGQISVETPLGKNLRRSQIPEIVSTALSNGKLPAHAKSLYLVLTAADVTVERFCMDSCATHSYINGSFATRGPKLPYAWVGNSAKQCPGMCAWPFAKPLYGPSNGAVLVAPNGDVGMDGMVINVALMLAGAATNPYGNGYYQGDASAPLESGTACTGIFGSGSYPGYPGDLLVDKTSGASYNAEGMSQRKYLLPAVWNPAEKACSTSF